jgi:hypothetical protein
MTCIARERLVKRVLTKPCTKTGRFPLEHQNQHLRGQAIVTTLTEYTRNGRNAVRNNKQGKTNITFGHSPSCSLGKRILKPPNANPRRHESKHT